MVKVVSDFISLFFPEFCLGCSSALVRGEEILCTNCILELPRTGYHFQENNPITVKFIGRLPIKYAGAFLRFRKTGIVQKLLHHLKYSNHPEIGTRLGIVFGSELKNQNLNNDFDLIIPMPLHPSRQRKRGYNQSSMFAKGLSDSLGIPYRDDVIVRRVNTSTQTRKSKIERWDNVKEAFRVTDPTSIRGNRILLVDDIITTGASIEACGAELHKHSCKDLSVACIAEA
jgi:ComF family protein